MRRLHLLLLVMLLAMGLMMAQEHPAPATPSAEQHSTEAAQNPNQAATPSGMSAELAKESKEAAGEGEHSEFKHSPSVKMVARLTGLSVEGAYWLLVILNFLIIAVLIGWALKKNLPGAFRTRTDLIRKSMDEARRASEDANRRLSEIEGRLSRMDAEIEQMKKTAEADAAAEEQKIRASAEEERRKIVEGAEQEIEAAAKAARRDLKAYVADLAVSLAEERIKVDSKADESLVGSFVHQLGKDGH